MGTNPSTNHYASELLLRTTILVTSTLDAALGNYKRHDEK
jgi:hypothetical protein